MSEFIINENGDGEEPTVSITDLRVVDDAGGQHLEGVFLFGQLVEGLPGVGEDATEAVIRPVANIRPEHTLISRKKSGEVVMKEGTMQVKPGKQRRKVDRWARQLANERLPLDQRDREARRAAVLGNLSIRIDPRFFEDGRAVLTDRDGNELTIGDLAHTQYVDLDLYKDAYFDTGVDSLSRFKAGWKAEQAVPGSVVGRRSAVRIWLADDEQAAAVAHAFNQEGDPVNATAAKYRHQDEPAQELARWLLDRSSHLGAKNIEILTNRVSANSTKLASFNTLSLAIEQSWKHTPIDGDEQELGSQADYLVRLWNALVEVRPEFGYTNSLSQRQEWRNRNLAGSALSVHGIVAAASDIYPSEDFSTFARLVELEPLMDDDGNPTDVFVDFFSYDNPLWENIGVLVKSKKGALTVRMSFQTRKAMADAILEKLGL